MTKATEALELSADTLREHLLNDSYSCEWLFQSYVVQKRAHIFSQGESGYQDEMSFRAAVARAVGVSIGEVSLVGSAQIGFSVKPGAPYRAFDARYQTKPIRSNKSDVDVAIVSRRYFDSVHDAMHNYTRKFKNTWVTNKYYSEVEKFKTEVPRADYNFLAHLARGWIRPDFAPDGFEFSFAKVKDEWRTRLDRKVSFAIYRDWKVLEDYQVAAFQDLRTRILKEL